MQYLIIQGFKVSRLQGCGYELMGDRQKRMLHVGSLLQYPANRNLGIFPDSYDNFTYIFIGKAQSDLLSMVTLSELNLVNEQV